jgi:multiple sugar transport system permease protein
MTAYRLHIYKFRGRRLLWGVILIIMMLPATLSFIGFYQFIARLKLLDNYIPLIIPAVAGAGLVPILIFYAFMSRFIISGITMGGIKE